MPQITVSQEVVDGLTELGIDDIAAHLKNKTDKLENQKIEKEWRKLSIADKRNKLKKI